MTDDLYEAVTRRMRPPDPPPFEVDPDKERRVAAFDRLREVDPVTANSPHLAEERAIVANYKYRKAIAEITEEQQ